jgi:hypothetical protein
LRSAGAQTTPLVDFLIDAGATAGRKTAESRTKLETALS